MTPHPTMAEALRLTRAGNLRAATSLIQTMLAGGAPAETKIAGDVIDLTPTHVRVSPKPKAASARSSKPVGDGMTELRHSGPAGTLDYCLYVPADAKPGMPVVVMLHGCTQSPEDFARGTGMNRLADELGFLVAYPRQKQSANPQKCWNWFKVGDQQRDRGEPALIAGVARDVVRDRQADPARVYVAGLSAGGAAAAIMAARYPDLFAAVGVHSGLACGSARDLPSALAAMRGGGGGTHGAFVPSITFHGDRDTTVHEANARDIVAGATAAFAAPLVTRIDQGRSPGGRSYTRDTRSDAAGRVLIEQWTVHGAGHAWSGGDAAGSYTDPTGPHASREMLRFFLGHQNAKP